MNGYGPVHIDYNGVAVPGSVLERLQALEARVAELEDNANSEADYRREQNERNT